MADRTRLRCRHALACTTLTLLVGLAIAASPAAHAAEGERPRDPWVFRCVLDKEARMIVIALHEHLYIAYDATDCSFRKAWSGGVAFDGAVYTTVHGPQPTSTGRRLIESTQPAFEVVKSDRPLPFTPIFKGYRVRGQTVTLEYELRLEDGSIATVHETPDVEVTSDGALVLVRRFEANFDTDHGIVFVRLPNSGDVSRIELKCENNRTATTDENPETKTLLFALLPGEWTETRSHFGQPAAGEQEAQR